MRGLPAASRKCLALLCEVAASSTIPIEQFYTILTILHNYNTATVFHPKLFSF